MKKIKCSGCDKTLKVPSSMSGKSALCPRCGTKINFVAKPKKSKPKEVWVELDTEQPEDGAPSEKSRRKQRPQRQPVPPVKATARQQQARQQAAQQAAQQPAKQQFPYRAPEPKGKGMLAKLAIAALVIGLPVGGFFVFPDKYKDAWKSVSGAFDPSRPMEHEIYGLLDLDIEKKTAKLLDELRSEYPETEDGKPVKDSGKVVLNLAGMTTLNETVEDFVRDSIDLEVEGEEHHARLTRMKTIIERFESDSSPLSEISNNAKLLATTSLQREIQDTTVNSLEKYFEREVKTIEKMEMPASRIKAYQKLTSDLESRIAQTIQGLKPEGSSEAAAEMFKSVERALLEKYESSANQDLDAALSVIRVKIHEPNKQAGYLKQLDFYFSTFQELVGNSKVYDPVSMEFVTKAPNELSPVDYNRFMRRFNKVVNEISQVAKLVKPPANAVNEIKRLATVYPTTAAFSEQLAVNLTSGAPAGAGAPGMSSPGAPPLQIEVAANNLLKTLERDYPETNADGSPKMANGRVQLNSDGINEYKRKIAMQMDKLINQPIMRKDFVRQTRMLKAILTQMRNQYSPLALVSPAQKTLFSARIQEKIQQAAVDAWESDYALEKMIIQNMPDLPESRIRLYLELNQELENKALEHLRTLAPEGSDPFEREMFEKVQTQLMDKEAVASIDNFDAVFRIIKNDIKDANKSDETVKKLQYLYEMHSQFMTIYKRFNYETQEFEVMPFPSWTQKQMQSESARTLGIVTEIGTQLNSIEPAARALSELERLEKIYPSCASLSTQLKFQLQSKANQQQLAATPLNELLAMRKTVKYQAGPELEIVKQVVARLKAIPATQRQTAITAVVGEYGNDITMWRTISPNQPFRDAQGNQWSPAQISAIQALLGKIQTELETGGVRI